MTFVIDKEMGTPETRVSIGTHALINLCSLAAGLCEVFVAAHYLPLSQSHITSFGWLVVSASSVVLLRSSETIFRWFEIWVILNTKQKRVLWWRKSLLTFLDRHICTSLRSRLPWQPRLTELFACTLDDKHNSSPDDAWGPALQKNVHF